MRSHFVSSLTEEAIANRIEARHGAGVKGEPFRGVSNTKFVLGDTFDATTGGEEEPRLEGEPERHTPIALTAAEVERVAEVHRQVAASERGDPVAAAFQRFPGQAVRPKLAAMGARLRSRKMPVSEDMGEIVLLIRSMAEELPGDARILLGAARDMANACGVAINPRAEGIFTERGAWLAARIGDLIQQRDTVEHARDRSAALRAAQRLWEVTYRCGWADDAVLDRCLTLAHRVAPAELRTSDLGLYGIYRDGDSEFVPVDDAWFVASGRGLQAQRRLAAHYLFLAKWAQGVFPILQTSHTFGAALMLTDVHPDAWEGYRAPWPAFRVEIPPGLLAANDVDTAWRAEGPSVDITHVDVGMLDAGPAWLSAYAKDGFRVLFLEGGSLADLLSREPDADHPTAAEAQRRWNRFGRVIQRLVAGLLLVSEATPTVARSKTTVGRPNAVRDRGEPGHRRIVIGTPITVDARPALADYLAGKTSGPSGGKGPTGPRGPLLTQTWVRGHFRRQACGVGRQLRRVRWIQPHPRGGDADAPFLVRPRLVRGG